MDNNIHEEKHDCKIKNLKVFKAAMKVLACTAALVQNPIMLGVSVVAGVGAEIAGAILDVSEPCMVPVAAVPAR